MENHSDESDPEVQEAKKFKARYETSKINTYSMRKLSATSNNGSQTLKNQIIESFLRVKAAKSGAKIDDFAPSHQASFFVPHLD